MKRPGSSIRTVLLGAGSLAAFAAGLAAAAVLGPGRAGWVAAGCMAAALVVAWALTARRDEVQASEPYRGRSIPHSAYPQFDRLSTLTASSVQDRRYFDRVLAPRLRELAADLGLVGQADGPDGLRALVGAELWPLLDPSRPPETDTSRGAPPPSARQLAAILQRLAERVPPWS